MSEESGLEAGADQRVQVQFNVERIYLKDVSFESPVTPEIFAEQASPDVQVDLNTRVNALEDERHEVVLSLTVTVKQASDGRVAYLVEVQQARLFSIKGAEGGSLQQVLGIHCPNTLFPYLREAVDDLVIKGGFPPLRLAPVNFEALYQQALAQRQQEGAEPH